MVHDVFFLHFQPIRVSIRPLSNDRKFESKLAKSLSSVVSLNEDLECQFCEALVQNVRNILVTNTSESEFIQVLTSLCKQTGGFSKEVKYFLCASHFLLFYSFYLCSAKHLLLSTAKRPTRL